MATRWAIRLEYDGAAFAGWQVQPVHRTVQGVLEETLAQLLGHPVRVHVAGRTDAGVHALGQVAAFDTDVERSTRAIRDGLNALLPPDVACLAAWVAPVGFDPRRWSHGKHYRYRWMSGPSRSPLRDARVWWHRKALDVPAMHEAVQALVGTHDLDSFRSVGCSARSTRRTVDAAQVQTAAAPDGEEIWLDVHGHGFLRHTVRIVAGCLTEIGLGKRPPSWFAEVLEAKDRQRAGRTAPAYGLTLMEVKLGEGPRHYADASDA